ncbi:MAG: helix-turn-helix transcriptional regulator [Clostridia bacterium]|nr:helix-turn-helix transcriptional regulator [Clostridia bacterium]
MKIIGFEELYHSFFYITEPFVKNQNWYSRNNLYSCIGKPKPSHTFLWFVNSSARITDSKNRVLIVEKNQLAYMPKGIEYTVEFFDTAPNRTDTIVMHFDMKDIKGNDIAPADHPVLCLKNVDIQTSVDIKEAAEEFQKSLTCIPEITALIYKIFAIVSKKRRKSTVKHKFSYIKEGIELLESDSNKPIDEIAKICGVSEGYFRKLFREYSGDNPIDFRQKHRIEKAKQMLLLDTFTIGEIAQELHFSDIYHFSKTFKKFVGVSPKNFLKQNT